MKQFFSSFDWILFLTFLGITIFSLILNYFLSPNSFFQQIFYVFLGLIFFFLFSRIDFRIWEKLGLLGFLGSIVFLLTPFVFGTITRGALRWIRIGPFTLQPSELVKPFLIIFFASFFSSRKTLNFRIVFFGLLFLLIPFLLIFFQPDLGSSLVVGVTWVGILFAAGVPFEIILGGVGVGAVFLPLAWMFFLKEYQRQRILSFLDPWTDPLGKGYNLIQSTVAVGAGQFFGRGLGRGTQSGLQFLPERHTDFIFASFAEDFGFLGVLVLLLLFGVLLWRILEIGRKAASSFAFLFCVGVFSLIFIQSFINIGMNLGLLPIAGVPLPLFSYGGSSFLATMMSLGIVENICYNTTHHV
ncbi:MAG: rod shape-determining protein RodA [Microgenomates group bacterium]